MTLNCFDVETVKGHFNFTDHAPERALFLFLAIFLAACYTVQVRFERRRGGSA